jgi:hypothetical protein
VINLEDSLGVKHVKMSFDEVWDADPPEDAKGDSLLEYMKDVRFRCYKCGRNILTSTLGRSRFLLLQ